MAVPEAFCAPDTAAVYVVLPDSELDGVNVATVSAALNPTDPATLFPDESFTVNDTELAVGGQHATGGDGGVAGFGVDG